MTRPRRYLTRMLLFLTVVAAVVAVLIQPLIEAFLASAALNGLIVGVMVLGIGYIFRQVLILNAEVAWIERYRAGQAGREVAVRAPSLLAPMAAMLGERTGRLSLSALATRSVLDGIAARLDESRDISRYLIGLLIFLGLLGTFWGLLSTINAVGGVISGLSISSGELSAVFNDLKAGLKAPLAGMGTAFSSSLLGLSGSLVLGFLDLQAGQAQNRFYNDLEDWLATQTRLSSGGIVAEGDTPVPVFVQALLEQTADSLESLQRTMQRGEEARIASNNSIAGLSDRLGTLTDQMRTEQTLMMKLAESQLELKPVLAKLAEGADRGGLGGDDQIRTHLRNLDVYMARMLEELSTGRAEMVEELRAEIRVLSRTLAAFAERPGVSRHD